MKEHAKAIIICIFACIITLCSLVLISFIDSVDVYNASVEDDLRLLYEDYDNNIIRSNITRIEYNNIKIKYSNLKNKKLNKKIEQINKYLTKKEIKQAWTKLNIKYISQNENGVLNGCEAACLLMALQYKGYLKNTTLRQFAKAMPKSNDPEKGFYLDIYTKIPPDISHWIAPKPLRDFGAAASGNEKIVDATGYSLDELDNEVKNGNPVIIYLTAEFTKPEDWKNGVPKNLHVQLLAGYNEITKEHLIIDSWKYKNKSSYWYKSKKEIEKLYNELGKRAVIVR